MQNFVDGQTPVVSAAWLNSIDVFYTTTFNAATTPALARTALGLGSMALQASSSITVTGGTLSGITITSGTITGITDLAIADGGTGASTAATAFAALKQAADESTSGVVQLATAAQIKTGTSTTLSMSPQRLRDAIGFSAYFESAAQTLTAAGALTIAHGLGRKPILVIGVLKNAIAEQNYSIGDEFFIPLGAPDNGATQGIAVIPDATNLNVRFANNANMFNVINKTTGALAAITNANWTLLLRAWA